MKLSPPHPRLSRLPAAFALLTLLPLAGCISVRVHAVRQTVVASNVLDATLDQLLERLNTQYAAIQSLQGSVDIAASTGGEHEGEVKEIPSFAGYVFLRKPGDLRVLMLLPIIRSVALDMVSDGKTFKLYVPPKKLAIVGDDVVIDPPPDNFKATASPGLQPHPSGLDTIRPNIIRDALLIAPLAPDEFYTLNKSSRTLTLPGHKELMEEPDYDITVLRRPTAGPHLEYVRVIHFGRLTLLPYQQDIYDHEGRIVTTITYSKYAKTAGIDYPMNILIKRPIDEYTLNIAFTKLQLNTTFDDDQFYLKIPDNIPIKKM